MNKSELIDAVATSADLPKAAVLVGFGTFATKNRAARTGRNPQTGAPIQIKAARVPSFKAGKALKESVNSLW